MKKAVKAAWIDALVSGAYKQGKGQLGANVINPDPYLDDESAKSGYVPAGTCSKYNCCLGVLTDLYCQAKGKKFEEVANYNDPNLPPEVIVWAGLTAHKKDQFIPHEDRDPVFKIDGFDVQASMLNDGGEVWEDGAGKFKPIKRHSFEKIAQLIDEQL